MSDFDKELRRTIEGDYIAMPIKYDSLGRRRHYNQDNNKGSTGRPSGNGEGLTEFVQIRMTPEMKKALIAKSAGSHKLKGKNFKQVGIAEVIRTYIEWGLENDDG